MLYRKSKKSKHLAKVKKKKRKWHYFGLLKVFLILVSLSVSFSFSQELSDKNSRKYFENQLEEIEKYNFIQEISSLAQKQQEEHGILSSIILAQACLESDFGRSSLASKYYNLFGVKAYTESEKITLETQEFTEEEEWITIRADFRVYRDWSESIEAHSNLFVNGVDWDPEKYYPVLSAKDYKEAAKALQSSGYATDLDYSKKIIKMIESYSLYRYD
ncbi:MAG: glycoside hydrolase family 73 protein [Lactovum sp.]